MEKIRLAIAGCGVMGTRHLAGFLELTGAGLSDFQLVAACDAVPEKAQILAKSAEEQLDGEVKAIQRLEELASVDVQAIDLTTPPWNHHTLSVQALQRGWHVMVEKPMGATVKACRIMREAADKSQAVLSVAENFHYDPMNRIGRELLRAGAIGKPRFMISNSVGGGTGIIVTPWRHYKRGGGPLLDVGVHNAYVTEYLMGEVDTVYAHARLYEKVRRSNTKEEIKPDAEDAVYATFLFKSGAVGQYIEDHAGHGQGLWQRIVYGSEGSLHLPHDRSGKPVTMTLEGRASISDERILESIPDFHLNQVTAALLGGERIWRYDLTFPEIDRKLLAAEYADFASAILKGQKPEVDLMKAARSVGLPYAMLEASKLGRAVTMEEIMKEKITAYQDEINGDIGLTD